MAGTSDPLHSARDRRRRLDLYDQIDRAHVDAELERAGRDERGETTGLEVILDAEPLLSRDRAMVRVDQLFACELVERAREALCEPPGVHEDKRRAVRADELEDLRVDRGPDRRALDRGHGPGWDLGRLAQARHVLDRDFDAKLERLLPPGVQHANRARDAVVEAAEEPRDLVERTLRRGEADALQLGRAPAAQLLQPLERKREVRSPLGRDHRVDLVDDDALHASQSVAREACEDEVQRLRRSDEDVRRLALVARALARRRVAGLDGDGRFAIRDPQTLRLPRDHDERLAQVALDVDSERFER